MKLEFHEQTEVHIIIPPVLPYFVHLMRGGKDRYLNDVFPLLQTLEPRRQREVEHFITSSLQVTRWKLMVHWKLLVGREKRRKKKKKFRLQDLPREGG